MLPAAAVELLDLSTLTQRSESYVDDALRDSYADIVYSVKLRANRGGKQRDALVYLLLEHKSEPDRMTALQLLRYLVRIWDDRKRNRQPLCPVIPLVVYHGEVQWTSQSFDDLISYPPELANYAVKFEFPVLDLWREDDRRLTEDGDPLLHCILILLKYGRVDRLRDYLEQIFRLAVSDESRLTADRIHAILVYIMSSNTNVSSEDLRQNLHRVLPSFVYPDTIADKLRNEGREEGLLAGKIQMLEEICGQTISPLKTLAKLNRNQLQERLSSLQATLRDRK